MDFLPKESPEGWMNLHGFLGPQNSPFLRGQDPQGTWNIMIAGGVINWKILWGNSEDLMKVFLNKNPSESKHVFRRETPSLEEHTKISRTIFQTSKKNLGTSQIPCHGLHVCLLLGVPVKGKSETYIKIKTQIPMIVYRHIPGNASIFCGFK